MSPELQKTCDDTLQTLYEFLIPWQEDYKKDHGIYWQGLSTNQMPPKDGATISPDKAVKPTNQQDDWSNVPLPTESPLVFRCDTYDGPKGDGFTVSGRIIVKDITLEKTLNKGPEDHREKDWHEIRTTL